MPEPAVGLRDAGELIVSVLSEALKMTARVDAHAPATEVALAATALLCAVDALMRLRLTLPGTAALWAEAEAAGVAKGIAAGRAQVLAEQAAEAEAFRASAPRLHVIRDGPPGTARAANG